jgi:hypothetical protein
VVNEKGQDRQNAMWGRVHGRGGGTG